MSNFARRVRRVRRGGGVDAVATLNALKPKLDDGYHLSDFTALKFGGYRAFVYKDGVFPPPDSSVRARVELDDREARRPSVPDIVYVRVMDALKACEKLIEARNASVA